MHPKRQFSSTSTESWSNSEEISLPKGKDVYELEDKMMSQKKRKKSANSDKIATYKNEKKSSIPDKRIISYKKEKISSIPNKLSNIEPCILSVTQLAETILSKANNNDRKAAEKKFKEWNGCSDKSQTNSYFDDFLFRAVYVSNLYERRVESFYNLLTDLGKRVDFKKCNTIMSLGCGACPEIVAFLHYYEKDLGFKNYKALSEIIGIDAFEDWEMYHPRIEKHFKKNVVFKKDIINEKYTLDLNEVDLLLMSYSYGPEYGNIWEILKTKCKIIIILHNNEELFSLLESKVYQTKNFQDNEDRKSYSYYTQNNL